MRRLIAIAAVLACGLAGAALAQQGAPMFGGFLSQSADPISIDADSLSWTQQDGRDVLQYTGGVVATRGAMRIEAARLTVFLPAEGSDRTFDRIEASGNVRVDAGSQTAAAELAVMDMVAQTVVMTGTVSIFDGANEMAGNRLTIDLATGNWQLGTGGDRVRTVVNPNQGQ